jgi:hypothetical protein
MSQVSRSGSIVVQWHRTVCLVLLRNAPLILYGRATCTVPGTCTTVFIDEDSAYLVCKLLMLLQYIIVSTCTFHNYRLYVNVISEFVYAQTCNGPVGIMWVIIVGGPVPYRSALGRFVSIFADTSYACSRARVRICYG